MHDVIRVSPAGLDENELSMTLPLNELRSVLVANAKEQHWLVDTRGFAALLFIDVTRIVDGAVLEKPKDRSEMIDQIMRHSGRDAIIRTAITARSVDKSTQTLVIDAVLRARQFTYREAKEVVEKTAHVAMNIAGSLGVENHVLFDRRRHIQWQIADAKSGNQIGGDIIPWRIVDANMCGSLISGAHPMALQHLVNNIQ